MLRTGILSQIIEYINKTNEVRMEDIDYSLLRGHHVITNLFEIVTAFNSPRNTMGGSQYVSHAD